MRVLVTGAGGLLGSEFVALGADLARGSTARGSMTRGSDDGGAAADVEIVGLHRRNLDVTDPGAASNVIGDLEPDWVVHCAAYTAVDGAEEEPEEAMRVNHGGTVNVAAAAALCGAKLVYISTDYVFDGTKGEPYLPTDPVGPVSVYARTKLAGEQAALTAGGMSVRTGWLYGAGGGNFVDAILRRAEQGQSLKVVDDQRGRPTWARNVAVTVVELLRGCERPVAPESEGSADRGAVSSVRGDERGPAGRLAGIWHVADGDSATWLEVAREAIRLRGLDVEVEGVSTEAWGAAAPRPAYSVLDVSATEARLGRPMHGWRMALAEYLGEEGERGAASARSSTKEQG